eukprot:scaffold229260_cov24-Tisochrysis_lutea.AAC.4
MQHRGNGRHCSSFPDVAASRAWARGRYCRGVWCGAPGLRAEVGFSITNLIIAHSHSPVTHSHWTMGVRRRRAPGVAREEEAMEGAVKAEEEEGVAR